MQDVATAWQEPEGYAQMVEVDAKAVSAAESDKGLFVRFFSNPVMDPVKSYGGKVSMQLIDRSEKGRLKLAEALVARWNCGAKVIAVGDKLDGMDHWEVEVEGAGRPIFDAVDYVFIGRPGDTTNIIKAPVWDDPRVAHSHTARFPRQWAEYKAGKTQTVRGTPLEQWPGLTQTQVAELKAMPPAGSLSTVEAVADMPDDICQRFAGLVDLRKRAQMFLEAAKGAAPMERLAKEARERDNQNADLRRQLDGQAKQMEAMAKELEALKAKK